jgi:hypothetical protein
MLHFYLPLCFLSLSRQKLREFGPVVGWAIWWYPYFRCAIFSVIFDFWASPVKKRFHYIVEIGSKIIYVPHLVCQELNNTIYMVLVFLTWSRN